jgi:hypothetical protein
MKIRAVIPAAIFLGGWLIAAAPVPMGLIFSPPRVDAEESWQEEFRAICGRTDDAATFSALELRGLIDRCDLLKARIGQLAEPQRKVFAKRLQMCRDLYAFTLEAKEKK